MIDPSFWKGRRVFLTGHTGFKGSWLSIWLKQLGAEVSGYALEPPTNPALFIEAQVGKSLVNDIRGDVRSLPDLEQAIRLARPEIVIHMAAQPLVRDSYADPLETYGVNVMGTVNLLEAARRAEGVKAILNVTSDKCYENREWVWGYRETDPMGGYDPYSSSKGCSELISSAYRRSFLAEAGIALATARAGNVIGGGDWAKDRLIPDAMRAFAAGKALEIRHPHATRPWQHVLEPLSGYLSLCQALVSHAEDHADAWNFGPNDEDIQPVSALVDSMVKIWGGSAAWQASAKTHPYEAQYLKLDCAKAKVRLGWRPVWKLEDALKQILDWYKARHARQDMHVFTERQVETYQKEHLI